MLFSKLEAILFFMLFSKLDAFVSFQRDAKFPKLIDKTWSRIVFSNMPCEKYVARENVIIKWIIDKYA